MTFSARPARPEEFRQAFDLLFSGLPLAERAYRTAKAMELIASGELDVGGVFVAPGGVFVCQTVPGGGGLVWPPVVHGSDIESTEDELIALGCDWLRRRGARLAQCLLAEEEVQLSRSLLRNDFRHVTGLTYLRLDPRRATFYRHNTLELGFEFYDSARPAEFHQTIWRSYEGTLDCPEVNGKRTIEEVIKGHQAQGSYDPSRWWLARRGSRPVGVLLAVEPSPGEWEIAYVGVVPEARRSGVGRALLLLALQQARNVEVNRVSLCVDDRNLPARSLYDSLGFEPFDQRRVLLRLW